MGIPRCLLRGLTLTFEAGEFDWEKQYFSEASFHTPLEAPEFPIQWPESPDADIGPIVDSRTVNTTMDQPMGIGRVSDTDVQGLGSIATIPDIFPLMEDIPIPASSSRFVPVTEQMLSGGGMTDQAQLRYVKRLPLSVLRKEIRLTWSSPSAGVGKSTEVSRIKCKHCPSLTFSRTWELHRHEREIHQKKHLFYCSVVSCRRHRNGFPRKQNRDRHFRTRHMDTTTEASASPLEVDESETNVRSTDQSGSNSSGGVVAGCSRNSGVGVGTEMELRKEIERLNGLLAQKDRELTDLRARFEERGNLIDRFLTRR